MRRSTTALALIAALAVLAAESVGARRNGDNDGNPQSGNGTHNETKPPCGNSTRPGRNETYPSRNGTEHRGNGTEHRGNSTEHGGNGTRREDRRGGRSLLGRGGDGGLRGNGTHTPRNETKPPCDNSTRPGRNETYPGRNGTEHSGNGTRREDGRGGRGGRGGRSLLGCIDGMPCAKGAEAGRVDQKSVVDQQLGAVAGGGGRQLSGGRRSLARR